MHRSDFDFPPFIALSDYSQVPHTSCNSEVVIHVVLGIILFGWQHYATGFRVPRHCFSGCVCSSHTPNCIHMCLSHRRSKGHSAITDRLLEKHVDRRTQAQSHLLVQSRRAPFNVVINIRNYFCLLSNPLRKR